MAVAPMGTQESTWWLIRAGTIFVTQGPRADVAHPLSGETHQFVGLRRGTPAAVVRRDGEVGAGR